MGLAWWYSGWESACQWADMGSIPGPRRACAPQLLSPHSAAESGVPRARAPQQGKSLQWEACAQQKVVPLTATRESPSAATKTKVNRKIKYIYPYREDFNDFSQMKCCLCSKNALTGDIHSLAYSSSAAQSYPTHCDPMDCSMPGLPVYHQLPEPAQIHVPWISDAIQPSHPLLAPCPPVFNLSQHQGLFPMSQFFTSGG